MELYPFYIEVTYSYYENNAHYVEKQEAVIIPANSFSQAVGKIEENYGEELVGFSCIAHGRMEATGAVAGLVEWIISLVWMHSMIALHITDL